MAKSYNYWSKESLEEFKKAWQFQSKSEILSLYPQHTYHQLKAIAGYYQIRKKISPRKKQLSKLLEWSPESCYWLGFLMGDGSFYKGAVDLCLAKKDFNHLLKYIEFLTLDIKPKSKRENSPYPAYRVQVEDIDTVEKIHNIFNFVSPKTYNPFNLDYILSHDYFIPFLAGYIDADGNIRTNNCNNLQIRILAHNNWKDNFALIANKLLQLDIDSKIYTKKYTTLYIHKAKSVMDLYKKVYSYNLPLLDRKWDIIKNY